MAASSLLARPPSASASRLAGGSLDLLFSGIHISSKYINRIKYRIYERLNDEKVKSRRSQPETIKSAVADFSLI